MRLAVVLALLAAPLLAQEVAPEAPLDGVAPSRVAVSRDVDFYGSDLARLLDVTLDGCQAACLADGQCRAFTYNTRNASCFPKGDVTEVRPFAGGISARVLPTDPAVLAQAPALAADLGFLQPYDLERAATLGQTLGRLHSSDEGAPADLLDQATIAESSGDALSALAWTGAALALTDDPATWRDYARLALLVPQDQDYDAFSRALPAAVAAYLRGRDAASRADALMLLAQALEAQGRTGETVPALRLAQRLDPGADRAAALDRVVGLYGFNVAGTTVESDLVSPRACARFNQALRAGFDYAPFVQVADAALTVTSDQGQLCVEGLAHGQTVAFTLREGLPSASGEALARDVPLTLYVRDRAPSVRALSRAYVLPRGPEATIPLQAVNLARADLALFRVSDRNLLAAFAEGAFQAPVWGWDRERLDGDRGEKVWEGSVDLAPGEANRDVVTEVPLPIGGRPAGVYVLTASVPGVSPDDAAATAQWFVLTDLGIATFEGSDGLTVAVRSLATAGGVEGATVSLVSRANAVLATATTDAEGVARFDAGVSRGEGGSAPELVTVTTGEPAAPADMAFLSLADPAFDLSDRGVEGRPASGPLDAYLVTDRGAYRPGETARATALLRDAEALAAQGLPLTAVLLRPDGVEAARATSATGAAGGHVFAFDLPANAPLGTWRLRVGVDPEAALADVSLLVEDFLPERVDLALAPPGGAALGEPLRLPVAARWLYGAPGAGLALEGEVTLAQAAAVPGWEGYAWGLQDAPFEGVMESFSGDATDEGGAATLMLALPDPGADPGVPLEARVAVRVVESSGRPVERAATVPVAPPGDILGLRVPGDVVPEGATAAVEVIALGPDLRPVAATVKWTASRVETDWQWYGTDGAWAWEPLTRRVRVGEGTVALSGDGTPATVRVPTGWGTYEVEVERLDGPYAAASATFDAGWFQAPEVEETPDRLQVSLDAAAYRPGDLATLRVVAEAAGEAIVTVLTDRVVSLQVVALAEGETTLSLPVTDEWGAGAYVAVHALRPLEGRRPGEGRAPARALGLAHAGVDPGDRLLSVAIEAPEAADPRGPLDVAVRVAGVVPGERAFVTLAAVDRGILSMTAFPDPDPAGWYFGQRRLGVELRDLYGRLVTETDGALGAVREGGDGAMLSLTSPPPTEALLAFFQGPVEVGEDGLARVGFDLPAFNGTVRLMAVAWSPTGVGAAASDVLVRDPVVLTASLPRHLSPGDRSRLRLDLLATDASGASGETQVAVEAPGLGLSEALAADLAPGEPWRRDLPLLAGEAGTETLDVALGLPDGRVLDRGYVLPVSDLSPPVARTARFSLNPGESFTFDDAPFAGVVAGTGTATLSVGALARLDAPGLLLALDAVPWGCTEQVASQTLPLLYLAEVARALSLRGSADLDRRIGDAVATLLANQDASGGFGLWGPGSGDLWLDAYVTDVLSRARATGRAVPEPAFRAALDNLRNAVAYYPDFEGGGEDLAYALLVLAREGQALVGDLRYFADQKAGDFGSPLAVAQLGAALALTGDQPRADRLFAQAEARLDAAPPEPLASVWRDDYGTRRRDEAAVLALAVESGSQAVDRARLAASLAAQADVPASTQEAAWTLLAAAALAGDLRAEGVTVDGAAPAGPVVERRDEGEPAVTVANGGGAPVDLTLTVLGVPEGEEPAGGTGWSIERALYTLEGGAVDPASVPLGARLVAVLTVRPQGFQAARLMVTDPLPGGFEIDNPNLLAGGETAALPWLAPVAAANAEARADRFLAAVDWQSDQPFQLAYVVRAVSPGDFARAAASVEDMYRPAMRARTEAGRVSVTE